MSKPITVADLIAACAERGIDPASTVVFVEADIPVPATGVEPVRVGLRVRPGLLVTAPDDEN